MALSVGPTHAWAGEVAVTAATIGTINTQTATDVTLDVPDWIDTTYAPVVTVASLDTGLVVGTAWVSAAGTVKVRIANISGGNVTPAATLTFKVVIL